MYALRRRVALGRLLSLVAVVGIMACQEPPVPADDPVTDDMSSPSDRMLLASAKIGLPPAGVLPADLPDPDSDGARFTVQYCTACHELASPSLHSATDWPVVLRRMWMRTEHLSPEQVNSSGFVVPVPQAGERMQILNYMIANSLQVAGTLPDLPGRGLFEASCSVCHALPDPRSHSSDDWVAVMDRMQRNMDTMLGAPLTQQQRTRLTLYLQRASA